MTGDFVAYLDENARAGAKSFGARVSVTVHLIPRRAIGVTAGRPVGSREWLAKLEAETERKLATGRRGPKPRRAADGEERRAI